MNENQDNYIIQEDYHGDVKLIRNNSKKVNLSKPTDTLEHKSKQIESLKVSFSSSNNKICLTKSKDLTKIDKDTIYQPNANLPLNYTIDKSDPPTSIVKEIFSKFKVWFIVFAIFIGFVSLCVSLHSVLSHGIFYSFLIFILTSILLLIMLSIIISPIIFIISLVCLVKSIKNSNTDDIIKSVILLIVSFFGLYIIKGVITAII